MAHRQIRVCKSDDFWPGERRQVALNGQHVVVFNLNGQICAFEDRCPHLGARLSDGTLTENILECHAHQWKFDITTGSGINPAKTCLKKVTTILEDDWITIILPERAG